MPGIRGRNLVSQVNLGAISTMRLPELKEAAKALGLQIDPKAKKAEIVTAIYSADELP